MVYFYTHNLMQDPQDSSSFGSSGFLKGRKQECSSHILIYSRHLVKCQAGYLSVKLVYTISSLQFADGKPRAGKNGRYARKIDPKYLEIK